MRKLMVLVVVVFCGFALFAAGCSDEAAPTSTTERVDTTSTSSTSVVGETPTTQTGSTTVLVLGDYALWGQTLQYANEEKGLALNLTVSKPEDVPDAEGMDDPEANNLVAMLVQIDNTGGESAEFLPSWFEIRDADGVAYAVKQVDGVELQQLTEATIDPAARVEGYVFFEIPAGVVIATGRCDVSQGAESGALRTWSD